MIDWEMTLVYAGLALFWGATLYFGGRALVRQARERGIGPVLYVLYKIVQVARLLSK
jgi:hypothetical protein